MNEGTLALLTITSSILAAMAVGISLLVLRRLSKVDRDTTRLSNLLYFRELEAKQRRLVKSVDLSDKSLKSLTDGARVLGFDVSRTFADIAQLLNETHKLEGNPRPHARPRRPRRLGDRCQLQEHRAGGRSR